MIFKKLFGHKGILGMNARNLLYLKPYNPKKAIKLANDKIKTKQYLSTRAIPVPKMYQIIKNQKELENLNINSLPSKFVIKPNKGSGGEGIIPIIKKENKNFISISGKEYSEKKIQRHIADILSGRFSIYSYNNYAFIEQLIESDERLAQFSHGGLPDIRVVVHNLVPVMAMLRIPTKESDGKANLHMGAIGVGIDISKGKTTYVTRKNKIIDEIPDKGDIKNFQIPFWDEILELSSKCQLITNLGYLAADICIDKNHGPLLLEINARAGLNVQIANMAPLRKRLEMIKDIKVTSPKKGIRVAKDLFGNIVEKEIKNISGKTIINDFETIEILGKKENFKAKAQIDTRKQQSIIDEEFAEKNGLLNDDKTFDEEKNRVKLKLLLKDKKILTIMKVKPLGKDSKNQILLGKRDLKGFLIDFETKTESIPKEQINREKQKEINIKISNDKKFQKTYQEIDEKLYVIDSKLRLLHHLKPINLAEQRAKFLKNPNFNPQFEYTNLKFDPVELINQLEEIKLDNSIIGQIFKGKKEEIIKKINIILSIGENDFMENSIQLYGLPKQKEIEDSEKQLELLKDNMVNQGEKIYDTMDAKRIFEEAFKKYHLNNKVIVKDEMVSSCTATKRGNILIKKGKKYSMDKIKSLIVHELETHILTALNGKEQNYKIFMRGLANNLSTQEGLAIYNVEKERHYPFTKNHKILSFIYGMGMSKKMTFLEIFNELYHRFKFEKESAFDSVVRIKRGFKNTKEKGCFTKDYVYYKGYFEVKEFLENGGNYEDLYLGKFNLKDLKLIKQLPDLKKPKYLPEWLKK